MSGRFASPPRPGAAAGFEHSAVPAQRHRLFFALWPDEEVRREMEARAARLRESFPARGRWIGTDRYHITLQFIGSFGPLPDGLLDGLRRAGGAVRAQAFELTLDRAGSFPNRAIPWWLGCSQPPPELHALVRALDGAIRLGRIRVEAAQELRPHVTVLRDADRPLPATDVEPLRWPIREFVLLESRGDAETRYHELGRWRLLPPP